MLPLHFCYGQNHLYSVVKTLEVPELFCTLLLNVASIMPDPFSSLMGQKAKNLSSLQSALKFFHLSNVILLQAEICSPLRTLSFRVRGLSLRLYRLWRGPRVKLSQIWRLARSRSGISDGPVWRDFLEYSRLRCNGVPPRAPPQRNRTLAKWPLQMVAVVEFVADPAAITLS